MSNEKKRAFFEFNDAEKDKIRTIVTQWTKVMQDNESEKGLRADLVVCTLANFIAQVCARTAKFSKGGINEAFILECVVSFTMATLRNAGIDIDKQEEEFSKKAKLFEQEQELSVKPGEA